MPSTSSRPSGRARLGAVREFFWLIDLAVLVLFVFFLALGAFGIGDNAVLTGLIAALGIAYAAHVLLQRRSGDGRPDAQRALDRERRGF